MMGCCGGHAGWCKRSQTTRASMSPEQVSHSPSTPKMLPVLSGTPAESSNSPASPCSIRKYHSYFTCCSYLTFGEWLRIHTLNKNISLTRPSSLTEDLGELWRLSKRRKSTATSVVQKWKRFWSTDRAHWSASPAKLHNQRWKAVMKGGK